MSRVFFCHFLSFEHWRRPLWQNWNLSKKAERWYIARRWAMAATSEIFRHRPLEFIAAITQHIPERLSQMVRHIGWYSNRMRGDRRKAEHLAGEFNDKETEGNGVFVISGFRAKKVPPLVWWERIKKVWEVDPLLCSHCGGLMKIISFIYERKAVRKILGHLGRFQEQEKKRGSPRSPKKCTKRVVEHYDDDWPEYEEPSVDVRTLYLFATGYCCPNYEYISLFLLRNPSQILILKAAFMDRKWSWKF